MLASPKYKVLFAELVSLSIRCKSHIKQASQYDGANTDTNTDKNAERNEEKAWPVGDKEFTEYEGNESAADDNNLEDAEYVD